MRVALIGVQDPLATGLHRSLGARHQLIEVADAADRDACTAAASCDVVVQGHPTGDVVSAVDHATRGTWNVLTTMHARRFVQLSSMTIFDGYPDGWAIDEAWIPRPKPDAAPLAAYLGELTAREISRTRAVECVALRLDRVVTADAFEAGPVRPDWLHVDDAVSAIAAVVQAETLPGQPGHWRAMHVVRGDGRYPLASLMGEALSFRPAHRGPAVHRPTPTPQFPTRPPALEDLPAVGQVSIVGAGGPLGAVTATALSGRHRLLLTDSRPLQECPQQSPGAPLPNPVVAPNVERLVDITDPAQVAEAAAGTDCMVNCAVNRTDVDLAFAVNVIGALNVLEAAVIHDVRRVVFTGPALTFNDHPVGYNEDRDISETTPPRPGDNLYFLTKFLAQEISRIYAEHHAIACPALLFCGFVNPRVSPGYGLHPFSVTWADAGRAMANAVEVDRLPEPFPILHIHAESPHSRYRNDVTRAVLGWDPQDRLDQFWFRSGRRGSP